MRYVAVPIAFLRRDPAASASNSALGGWLKLYGHAAELEAGGIIPNCIEFDDRRWLSAAGVNRAELEEAVVAALVEWRASDLVVHGYDLEGESKVKACRANGKSGGRPKKGSKTQVKPIGKPDGKPTGNQSVSAVDKQAENPPANPGETNRATQTKPRPNLLSGPIRSVSDPISKGEGGDPDPSSPPDVDLEPEPDRVDVLTHAYRVQFECDPTWGAEEIAEARAVFAGDTPEVVAGIASRFFAADGDRPGDRRWRERSWNLHMLATQGIKAFRTLVIAELRDGAKSRGAVPGSGKHWGDSYE